MNILEARRRLLEGEVKKRTAEGNPIVLRSLARMYPGLNIYGWSKQDGTPTPENPVPIVSAGDEGEINVTVQGGNSHQTLTIQTPGGLPGIPVSSGGNYTDESGQQWICDEVDFDRGKYAQRVWRKTFDGSENWYRNPTYFGFYNTNTLEPGSYIRKPGFSNQFLVRSDREITLPGLWIGVGNSILYSVHNDFYDDSLGDFGIANWKTHLAQNPMEVMTYLETPIEIDLSDEELAAYKALHTYSPATTVSNDAGAWMKVEYKTKKSLEVTE